MSETKYKYGYQKIMAENNLSESDLPSDAKICVNAIKNIEKAISMAEKSGKKINPETMAKIKANDKWACNEILDFVEKTDDNEEDAPYEEDEIIEELNNGGEQSKQSEESDAKGVQIDADFKKALESGKSVFSLSELNSISKLVYDVVFDNYDESGDNGIETSHYSLIETDEEVFTLTKK